MKPRFVCATGFSSADSEAALAAASLARRQGAELELVHVLETRRPESRHGISVLRTARKWMAGELRKLEDESVGIETVFLARGVVTEALVDYLRGAPPALAVLSSGRKSDTGVVLHESVSDYVAQHAPCPVLAVRKPERLVGWANRKHPLRILAAVDLGVCSANVVRWLARLRDIDQSEITICHVDAGVDESGLPVRRRPRVALERDLRKMILSAGGPANAGLLIKTSRSGAIETTLSTLAREMEADLLLVGSHQRHGLGWLWHGSASRALMHLVPTNVVCVPMTAEIGRTKRR